MKKKTSCHIKGRKKYIYNFQKREELSQLADQDIQRIWEPLGDMHTKLCFRATLLGRGALRVFLGAYFKIHKKKKKEKRDKLDKWSIGASCWTMPWFHEKEVGLKYSFKPLFISTLVILCIIIYHKYAAPLKAFKPFHPLCRSPFF